MNKQFNIENLLQEIDLYIETAYSKLPIPEKSKVFYRLEEWSGWRFYLKALRNKDWNSIVHHLKSTYAKDL